MKLRKNYKRVNFGNYKLKFLCCQDKKKIDGYHNWAKTQAKDYTNPLKASFWMRYLVYGQGTTADRISQIEFLLQRRILISDALSKYLINNVRL